MRARKGMVTHHQGKTRNELRGKFWHFVIELRLTSRSTRNSFRKERTRKDEVLFPVWFREGFETFALFTERERMNLRHVLLLGNQLRMVVYHNVEC